MIKLIADLLQRGITPVFDTRLKAHRVEYLLARGQQVYVARGGLGPQAVGGWLGGRLAGSHRSRHLLSERQSLLLWEQTIADSRLADALLDTASIARWAREAAGLAGDFKIPWARLANDPSLETQATSQWWRSVRARQQAEGWLDPRDIFAAAAAKLDRLPLGSCSWLDRNLQTPVSRSLAGAMHPSAPAPVQLGAFDLDFTIHPNPTEELRAAAAWAFGVLEQTPTGQITVVVPGLSGRIEEVQQAFADVGPHTAFPPFFAGGTPLIAQPDIRAALALVDLVLGNRSFGVASTLLRAPSMCGGEELTSRAALERNLRQQADGQVWLLSADGLSTLDPRSAVTANRFRHMIERLSAARPRPGHHAPPMSWVDDIRNWLRLAGWQPGTSTTDQVWNDVLMRVVSLGFAGADYTGGQLIAAVRREASDARVPSTMGPLEVVGRIGDVGPGCQHVWVTGMTETQFPHLPKPNPMLPLALQREYGMPGASAEARGQQAAAELARVRGLAAVVKLSLPQSVQDAPARPHPLLSGLPGRMIASNSNGPGSPAGPAALEQIADPMPPMQGDLKGGGRRALDLQARCPALAFFESRLGVEALELPQRGVRRQQQGIWAHQVAEALFKRLPSRAEILAADSTSRQELVATLVETTLSAALGRSYGAYQAALKVEQRLLEARMLALLELESRRPEFTVVAREASRQLQVGPLQVALRLDRIDALASGELAVLDYKTGMIPRPSHWLEPPLQEVQLPLYVLAAGDEVAAAVFLQIHTHQPRYRGSWPKGEFPGQPRAAREWSALRILWEKELHRLADDLVSGRGWRGFEKKLLEGPWAPLSRVYADE